MQLYSLALLVCSVLVYLWLEHYLAVAQDLSYALPIFLLSLSVSTFWLSFLACCCLVRPAAPAPLGYLVSLRRVVLMERIGPNFGFIKSFPESAAANSVRLYTTF